MHDAEPISAHFLTSDYLVFQLGTERYALPSECVREVARHTPLTPVPGAPPELPGIISRHGAVLPVVDARQLLGLPSPEPTRASRMLTLHHEATELVLLADGVFDLLALPNGAFGPLPTALEDARARLLAGLTQHDAQPLMLLDLPALLTRVREGA